MLTTLRRRDLEKKRYAALNRWTDSLQSVHGAVAGKLAKGGPDAPGMPPEFGMRELEGRW
jgi:COP9 signalosome complex subunit 2